MQSQILGSPRRPRGKREWSKMTRGGLNVEYKSSLEQGSLYMGLKRSTGIMGEDPGLSFRGGAGRWFENLRTRMFHRIGSRLGNTCKAEHTLMLLAFNVTAIRICCLFTRVREQTRETSSSTNIRRRTECRPFRLTSVAAKAKNRLN